MTTPQPVPIEPTARTAQGVLRGTLTNDGEPASLFAGIPFAAPPIGPLRLRPPQPPTPWAGVREATAYPAGPAQRGADGPGGWETSEDCLYLNVWTPELGGSRPVLVWIYGGGFELGTASPPTTDGAALSRLTGAVVVAPNYRVGALGWLNPAGPDAAEWRDSANLGLQDQTAALHWIQDNIAAFGGDPANITIAGHSAGAFSIGALLTHPAARGTFHKAILHSGSIGRLYPPDISAAITEDLMAQVGAKTMAELRTAPLSRIIEAQHAVIDQDFGARNLPGGRAWGLVHDGTVITEDPAKSIAAGAATHIPLLIGANRDEFRTFQYLYATEHYRHPADERALLAEMELAGVQHPHDLLEAYRTHEARDASTDQSNVPASAQSNAPSTELSDLRTRFLSDAVYRRRATHLANLQTKAGGPAHTYLFSAEPLGPHYGAFHGSERFYAFGQLTLLDIDTPEHRATRDALIGAWRGFLVDGDPGWPAYDLDDPEGARTRQIGGETAFVDEPPVYVLPWWNSTP
ncbi:carboxylesterase family protein [Streptomyces sp. NBC_01288]|uniref:carboxylesterase/lipase family protein n=1 Tax=Streptomyces sp. NBC_01288 TaxID=2903814 RepID=UPI002E0DA303|nr:carboxylesterase family protein [Streptomyces sp. NBC_01288]